MKSPAFIPPGLLYPQIVERIQAGIISGQYAPGDRIPSVRELAADLEVNPNTVFRAYEILQDQGLIFPRKGLGLYVSEGAPDKLRSHYFQDFLERRLPAFFDQMKLFRLSLEEFTERYHEWQASKETPPEQ